MAERARPQRQEKERKQLTCTTCGAGNRLQGGVIERGFQRCTHCASAMPVEGAGSFAIEQRDGGFTRVVSPGKTLFVLLLGRVINLPYFILFLIGADFLTAAFRHLTLRMGAPAWLASTPTVLFVLTAAVLLGQLFVEQRILATQNRVETWWKLFGLTLRHRRFSSHGLDASVQAGLWKGLHLVPPGEKPILIRTENEGEAELLRRRLEEAVQETRMSVAAATVSCPGCGAPIATPMAVVEAGGVECEHCASGLLATKGGVVLGEVALSLAMDPPKGEPKIDRRRLPGAVEWRLHSELFARPVIALCLLAVGLVFGGGMAAGGVGLFVASAPFRAFGFIFAAILVPLGIFFFLFLTVSALGRHRVRLDPGVLEHEIRLFGIRVRRKLIPLARITDVKVSVNSSVGDWKIETAIDEISMELPFLDGEGAIVTEELFEALADGLREMGRVVRVGRSAPTAAGKA